MTDRAIVRELPTPQSIASQVAAAVIVLAEALDDACGLDPALLIPEPLVDDALAQLAVLLKSARAVRNQWLALAEKE